MTDIERRLPSRRDFLGIIGVLVVGAGGAAVASPALRAFLKNIDSLSSSPESSLEKEGWPEYPRPALITYLVKKGETLSSIGKKYTRSLEAMTRVNGVSQNYRLQIGETIRIPLFSRNFYEDLPEPEFRFSSKETMSFIANKPPEILELLSNRAEAVMDFAKGESFKEGADRDFLIFELYNMGREWTKQDVLEVLAQHEANYILNPVVERFFQETVSGTRAINRLLADKLSGDLFKDGFIPQLPESLSPHDFIFVGGKDSFGGGKSGHGHPFALIYGDFARLSSSTPKEVLDIAFSEFAHTIWHESTHIKVQNKSKYLETGFDDLAHICMDAITKVSEEAVGVAGREVNPRVFYLYEVLRRKGVNDPYGEIIRAGAIFSSKRLKSLYEQSREKGDFSFSELAEDVHSSFAYTPSEESKELFRQEYKAYLSP